MTPADPVERNYKVYWIEVSAIDRNGRPGLEADSDLFGFVRRVFRGRTQHEQVGRWGFSRIFQHSALVGNVPDISIPRVDLVSGRRHRNVVRFGVSDGILAASDIPLPPRCDDREVWRERSIRQLEPHLIVAFARAPVGESVGSDLSGDFDLAARNERSPHRSAEEVLAAVDRASSESRPDEVHDKLVAKIFDIAFVSARGDRLRAHAFELVALTDIGRDADHSRGIVLLEPRNDDRCIESTGVGKGDCTDHGNLNKYSGLLNI